jgi:hypothetical protein
MLTMEDLFALREEMGKHGGGKIAIDRLARESTEWMGEITGMVEQACRGRNIVIAFEADEG